MSGSRFYRTDPGDPDAPVVLEEYAGDHGVIRPGDQVVYENPAWRQADGSYWTGGMDPPLEVTEIIDFGGGHPPQAILNNGEYEVSAANLRPEREES